MPARYVLALVVGVLVAAVPATASAQTKTEVELACHVGTEPPTGEPGEWSGGFHSAAGGLTPFTVAGATRVSPSEAACLIRLYPKARFITPIEDASLIWGSARIAGGWEAGTFDDAIQKNLVAQLQSITGGDKAFPLISYCHNRLCFMSYNLILRVRAAGYTNLYWLRDGLQGWAAMARDPKKFNVSGGLLYPGESDEAQLRRIITLQHASEAASAERKRAADAELVRIGPAIEAHGEALMCHPWADAMMEKSKDAAFWQSFKRASKSAAGSAGLTQPQVAYLQDQGMRKMCGELEFANLLDQSSGSSPDPFEVSTSKGKKSHFLADKEAEIDKRCRALATRY